MVKVVTSQYLLHLQLFLRIPASVFGDNADKGDMVDTVR